MLFFSRENENGEPACGMKIESCMQLAISSFVLEKIHLAMHFVLKF